MRSGRHPLVTGRMIAEIAALIGLVLAFALLALAAQAQGRGGEDERMLRDFGLLPEPPLEPDPVRVDFIGAPVPVTLGVGVERRIGFGQPFRIGLEPSAAEHFAIEIYGENLLIRSERPLKTRAKVQLADGRIVPLDIHAALGAGTVGPLEIVVRSGPDPARPAAPEPEVPDIVLAPPPRPPGYVELVRFAAQRMYAPARLFEERPGLRAAPVRRQPVRLVRGARILATPLASWEQGGLTVTAVRIDNRERRAIDLDPRQVVGVWRAASFHHGILSEGGSTALYLVSDRPFAEALGIHAKLPAAGEPLAAPSGEGER